MTRAFDAIIVGAGQAGPPLAGRLTAAGQRVALIERHLIGGTCVNTGCMPTKAWVACARTAHVARRAADFGVMLEGAVRVDMRRVQARAETVRQDARQNLEKWLRGMDGLTLIEGHARFVASQRLQVGDEVLEAPRIFLNVGGRATVPDIPALDQVDYLTNTSILDLDTLPEHLVVVGGSYIGLEFAQMFRRFGAQVTIVEKGPRLIAREDEDVSAAIREILEAEGIRIVTDAERLSFARHPQGIAVSTSGKEGIEATNGAKGGSDVMGGRLLLAIGRTPNTADLGLDQAGVATDSRGYIQVDSQLQTSAPGVWALGDCNGRGAFTHTAYNDFEIIAANLLDGERRRVDDRVLGYALYIDPPLGRVGMSEAQARQSGRPVTVATRPMKRVGRAVEKHETQGFIKIVADADSRQILGAAILGIEGDEAIHGLLDAINARTPWPELRWAVPIHPTVSELIPTVLGELKARA